MRKQTYDQTMFPGLNTRKFALESQEQAVNTNSATRCRKSLRLHSISRLFAARFANTVPEETAHESNKRDNRFVLKIVERESARARRRFLQCRRAVQGQGEEATTSFPVGVVSRSRGPRLPHPKIRVSEFRAANSSIGSLRRLPSRGRSSRFRGYTTRAYFLH